MQQFIGRTFPHRLFSCFYWLLADKFLQASFARANFSELPIQSGSLMAEFVPALVKSSSSSITDSTFLSVLFVLRAGVFASKVSRAFETSLTAVLNPPLN